MMVASSAPSAWPRKTYCAAPSCTRAGSTPSGKTMTVVSRGPPASASRRHHATNQLGAQRHLDRVGQRAGHAEHHRCRVAEVRVENGPLRRGRQALERVEARPQVVPDRRDHRRAHRVFERHEDRRATSARGRGDDVDARDLAREQLEGPGDELLDVFSGRARPNGVDDRRLDFDLGVLPLRHLDVRDAAPDEHRDQRDPANLRLLCEDAREVHGVTTTRSPARRNAAPSVTTR